MISGRALRVKFSQGAVRITNIVVDSLIAHGSADDPRKPAKAEPTQFCHVNMIAQLSPPIFCRG